MSVSLSKNLPKTDSLLALQTRIKKQWVLTKRMSIGGNLMGGGAILALATAAVFLLSKSTVAVPVVHQLLANHSVKTLPEVIEGLARGPIGVTFSVAMLLIGTGLGIAKNSIMPVISGISFATFIWVGVPTFNDILTTPNLGGSNAIFTKAKRVELAPELLSANHLAYAAVHDKKKLTPSELATFHKDMTWLEAHSVKDWSNTESMSLSNKPRYLLKLTNSVGERTPADIQYIERQTAENKRLNGQAASSFRSALPLLAGAVVLWTAAFYRKRYLGKLIDATFPEDESLAEFLTRRKRVSLESQR